MRYTVVVLLVLVLVCAGGIVARYLQPDDRPAAVAVRASVDVDRQAPPPAAAMEPELAVDAEPAPMIPVRSQMVSAKAGASHGRVHQLPNSGTLVLLYTSSATGQIRSCNCTKFRFGGYGRQLTLLDSIRASSNDVVLVEGGDITGGGGFQARLKSGVAADALDLLGYDAFVPGDAELGTGGTQSLETFENGKVPLVCANLCAKGNRSPIYKPWVLLETGAGRKVALVGAVDPVLGGEFLERMFGQTLLEPSAAVGRLLPAVRKQSDLVVVVFHGAPAAAKRLAALDGVDLVLCTHRHSKQISFPSSDSNVVQIAVEKNGGAYVIDSGTNENWSLGRLDLSLDSRGRISSVKHQLFYLDRRYDEDPRMVKLYEAYNEAVAEAVLAESAKIKAQAEEVLAKRGVDVEVLRARLRRTPFAGDKACQECHTEVYESWASTRHAKAMGSLKTTRQEFDPECVGCHVTGITTRHGYENYKETPELANVQCEACHGPALEHTKSPEAGFGRTGEQTCRSCHTEERDVEFEFESYWNRIKHPVQN